jgi:hypothetical protein
MNEPIAVRATVPGSRQELFDHLSRLENHWALADRWIQVSELDGRGARVRVRGPLGIARTARTSLDRVEEPHLLLGTATLDGGTRAAIEWLFEPASAGLARVTLSATVLSASPTDRMLLACGGRIWLRRRLRATLARLPQLVPVAALAQ